VPATASSAPQEADLDDFAPVSTKKQGKKGKKKKASIWSEPEVEPMPDLREPLEAADVEDVSRGAIEEAIPVIEDPALSSSSKKKSKKDKKKDSLTWDVSESPEEQSPVPVPADQSVTADTTEPTREAETSAIEEPVFSSASTKKKSKKEKKKQFSAWDEPEAQEELAPPPEQAAQAVESQGLLLESTQEDLPVVDSPAPSSFSSKKSKKDKKKKKFSWDDHELPEEATPLPEPRDAPLGEADVQPAEQAPVPSSADVKTETESALSDPVPSTAQNEPQEELASQPQPMEAVEGDLPQQILPENAQEQPEVLEESAAPSSKKKSKKEKKKRLSAWDEPEASEGLAAPEPPQEVFESKEHLPAQQELEPSQEDIKIEPQLDSGSSLAAAPIVDATVLDGFSPAVSKKGKKGKKNRQSLAWSDSVPEPDAVLATPDDDDDAAFVDAEEMHAEPDPQLRPEVEQSTSKSELAEDLVAVAGSAAAGAAVAGLLHSERSVPETAEDELIPVSSKKSKKQKKQKNNLDWTGGEGETEELPPPESRDEFVDAEESPVVDEPLPLESQAVEATHAEM
jgi:hypothetical protein